MSDKKAVAFIGLGNMGSGMAANLVKAGFAVKAFDLSAKALEAAVAAGCVAAETAVSAVADVDYVVSMLPNGAVVESIYIDSDKLLEAIPPSAIIMDCSTIAAKSSRRLISEAGRCGIAAIDAPVSGGVAAAAAGTLSFMCGGEVSAVEAATPVLSAMGANVFRAGDAGAGQVAKICNNMLLAIHMVGTAEALQLGADHGLDPKVLSEIMLKSSGCNWSLEKYNPYPGVMDNVPASNDYNGGFMVNLMLKDLGLAMESAKASDSSTPMGSLAQGLYECLRESGEGQGEKDFSSVMNLFARGLV